MSSSAGSGPPNRKRLDVARPDLVSVRYAKALFEVARSRGQVDQVAGELGAAAGAFTGSASHREFWANPVVSLEKKRRVLARGLDEFGPGLSRECRRFLEVLLKNRRLELLPAIERAYAKMSDEAAGRVPVAVRTAMPLSEEQTDRLTDALGKVAGARPVLEVEEDASLLAGIVVTVRDVRYDCSVRGRLERFLARLSA